MTDRPLNYPPPWQDMVTLCKHLCLSAKSVENWVAQGILPAPRKRGGKLMWKWAEVDARLTLGDASGSPDADAERIKNATRREIEGNARH